MSSSENLKQIKINSLRRAYELYKRAEEAGTLKKVPLTDDQRLVLQPK